MTIRTGGWLSLLVLSGCAGLDGYTVAAEPEGPRWVSKERAEASGLPAWSLTMPLGERRDGTELVLEFLKSVESAGARYLTEVDLVLSVEQQGRPVECRTRLSPARPGQAPVSLPDSPETRPWRVAETRLVSEEEMRCQMVSSSHMVPETQTDWVYDSSTRSTLPHTSTRMVSRTDWHQECQPETVTRSVTRFVYQFHTGFVPPDLWRVANDASTPALQESAPECTLVPPEARARTGPAHRLEALIHGCADFSLPPEVNKPEAEMSRAERLRHEYRLKALAARVERTCSDKVLRLEEPSQVWRPEAGEDGGPKLQPCRDSAPPAVDKPEAEMSRAERLRQEYRRKALAAGKQDCGTRAP